MEQVLGVTVTGPAPVGRVHLPLRPGLNVIYGANGSGKSRLLQALERLLLGHARDERVPPGAHTAKCTAALYQVGGVHVHIDPATLRRGPDSAVGQVVGGLIDEAAHESGRIPSVTSEMFEALAAGVPVARHPAWDVPVGGGGLLDELIERIQVGACWPDPTEAEALELLEDGRWFVSPTINGVDLFLASRPDQTLIERWQAADAESEHRHALLKGAFEKHLYDEYPRVAWELLEGLPVRPDELSDSPAPWLATPVSHVATSPDGRYPDEPPFWQSTVGLVGERIGVTDAASSTRDPLYWRVRNMNLHTPGQPRPKPRHRYLVGSDGRASNDLRVAAELIENSANHQLSQLFADAPSLRLEVRDPEQWYSKDPIRWTATVGGKDGLELTDLGSAHQRYAAFAIQQATRGHDGRPGFAIIDEPERALHRAAEDRLCAALPSLAEHVIVASHSTSFLDADGALIHATRPSTRLRLDSEPPQADTRSIRDLAAILGVRRSDITARWRVIVLVEGPHDEAVIGAFCQDVLRRPDVHVVCLGGTRGLEHIASATLLFDLTDATLLVVTDNTSADRFGILHRGLITRGNDKARHGLLDDTRRQRTSQEDKALLAMLTSAVNAGTIDRFAPPFGFEKPDIVHYLPASEILPGCETWDDINRRFFDEHGQQSFRSGDGQRLKKWVNDQTNGAYKVPAIRNLAGRLAAEMSKKPGGLAANRPHEFSALARRILEQLDHPGPTATAAGS